MRSLVRRVPREIWRFILTGGIVTAVYFVTATTLIVLLGTEAQAAVVVAYVLSLAVHFTINRQFVFGSASSYAHSLSGQGIRYLVVALFSYAATAIAVAASRRTEVPELAPALATPVIFAAVTFLVLRGWVFRSSSSLALVMLLTLVRSIQ